MKWRTSVCTTLFAFAGLGCGGGEGSVGATNLNGEEPAPSLEPTRPARGITAPSPGGPGGEPGGPGGTGGSSGGTGGSSSGSGGTPSTGGFTCSGTYDCQGTPASLSQASDGCRVTLEDGAFTLASDGSVLYEGIPVGTWSGSAGSLEICYGGYCGTCTAL